MLGIVLVCKILAPDLKGDLRYYLFLPVASAESFCFSLCHFFF